MSSLPQYEFDEKQNSVIEQLSRAMLWIAVPLQIVGILYGLAVVLAIVQAFHDASQVFAAVFAALAMLFFLALGNWTGNAAQSFRRIVTTTGQDVTHLMDGLDNLRKMYSLLSLIVKVYVVVILITLIAGFIVAITGALHS
jgi:hypothetical protein